MTLYGNGQGVRYQRDCCGVPPLVFDPEGLRPEGRDYPATFFE